MAVRMWGHVVIQETPPDEAPVMVGTLWMNTADGSLYTCTSVAPYTFSEISGGGGGGDVSGPASSVANAIAVFADTTGKVLADSGKLLPAGDIVGTSDPQTLSAKTLTTPAIADFTDAGHTHQNNAGGGTLAEAALALSDNTTNNASSARHGFLPKLSNVATEFLNGQGAFAVPGSGNYVSGPASSVSNHLALFDGTDGKLLKDGGALALSLIPATATAIPFGSGSSVLTEDLNGLQYLTASKRLGVNMPTGVTPNATVTAYSTTSPFIGTRISANANANAITLRKARGSDINSPSKVLSGDGMGAFATQGYEEVTPTYRQTGIFQFAAREDFSNTAGGTSLRIDMCPIGSITTQLAALFTTEQLQLQTTTGIPAGGTTGLGLGFSSTSNFGIFYGSGAPSLSAAKGSLYLRSDGSGTNDRMYVNTNGGTTWTPVVTVG